MYPDDLRYTPEHEWVRREGDVLRFGITSYAAEALGDVVFVQLPEIGSDLTAGDPCGEVESTKSVSDIFAPVTGREEGWRFTPLADVIRRRSLRLPERAFSANAGSSASTALSPCQIDGLTAT